MGITSSYIAGVSLDHGKTEPASAKYCRIGLGYGLILPFHILLIDMEAVTVLHPKLPTPHNSKPRSYLIPEFGLDLEEMEGKLPVGPDFLSHQMGDHLFVGRPKAEIPFMAIANTQQLLPILVPPSTLLPKLRRDDHGQKYLLSPDFLHLLTNDLLDLADYPEAQG